MAGVHGHGSTIGITANTTIGQIMSISGPDQSRDALDVSTMDSSNKWREFIPGMLDGGEVTVEVLYGTTQGNNLEAYFTNPAEAWTITVPVGDTIVGSAFMTSLGYAIPFDDKITQSFTLKYTGAVVYTGA